MSFWCECEQRHVAERCSRCQPKIGVNEYGEIVRHRSGAPRPQAPPPPPEPPVDWAEIVRDEPAVPPRPTRRQGHVNESGEIVRDPSVPPRPQAKPPVNEAGEYVKPDKPGRVPLSTETPYRSTRIWCECRPPLPRGVDFNHWQVRCPACWRVRRGEQAEPAPPLKPIPPWQESPPPATKRPTVRPWERVVVLILLLLAATVVYLGWRF
jgi:hypothetical protein